MSFVCEKCDKIFKKKSTFINHINRKTSCVKEDRKNADKKICIYCNKIYTRQDRLNNHMLICKEKLENEKLKIIISEINDTLVELKNKPMVVNNNNNNCNNNTINIQQNIILPYGKEDIRHLTDEDYKRIFNKGCYAVSELIKTVHCDKNRPQNMNIYIKNLTNEYLFVYNGEEWDVKEKDDIIGNMIENKKNFLEAKYVDDYENLSKNEKYLFQKYLERSELYEVKNNVKKEIKMTLYNNRQNIRKTHQKQTKKQKAIKKPQTIKMIIEKDF